MLRFNLRRLTKINWKAKLDDPLFYVQVIVSFSLPVAAYLGIKTTDITTWGALFNNIMRALNNPYCVGIGLISVFNALIDSEIYEAAELLDEEVKDEDKEEHVVEAIEKEKE